MMFDMVEYFEKIVEDKRIEILTIQNIHRIFRFGFAFIFGYAGITGFINPEKYIKWLPQIIFNSKFVPFEPTIFLRIVSVAEILLAAWFLSGKGSKWAALTAAGLLTGINITNLGQMDILFRNVGLITSLLALYFFDNFFVKRLRAKQDSFWF